MPPATTLSPLAHQALVTMPALRGLAAADRERVGSRCREECWPAGTIVFREGDPGSSLYVVVSGEIDLRVGKRSVARLRAGEWLGETALLTGAPRSATAVVTLDCRLLALDTAAFAQLLAGQPHLYEQLAAILGRRLSATSRGTDVRRYEVVLVDNRGRWGSRRTVVEELAAALEREIGRAVAVVTLAARAGAGRPIPRAGRPDAILTGEAHENGALRERLATRIAALGLEAPLVLVEVEDELADDGHELANLADTVLVLAGSGEPVPALPSATRVVTLHDRRLGRVPALSSIAHAALPTDEPGRTRTLARLARSLTHRSVGIALGSGVAYGLAHIGVLDVLEQAGVPIDFVAGASMGAVVGAHYALGTAPKDLRRLAVDFGDLRNPSRVIPRVLGLAMDLNVFRPGMFSSERFLSFLEQHGPTRGHGFTDLQIPFRSVATDIETGARVEIGDGPLADAMRASYSVPGLLPPHRLGDRLLVDGGLCDPVPAETVRSMGADVVIAVNVLPALDPDTRHPVDTALRAADRINPLSYLGTRRSLPTSLDVVVRAFLIMQRELGSARAGEADVLVSPSLGRFWAFDFGNTQALVTGGIEAAEAALPAVHAAIRRQREIVA
jgi:NTE family protein